MTEMFILGWVAGMITGPRLVQWLVKQSARRHARKYGKPWN